MDRTKIEWTDITWNPTVGCSKVSPGCANCYAARQAHRFSTTPASPLFGLTRTARDWNGTVRVLPERLSEPFRWKESSRVFVDSMSDLFHDAVPDLFIASVWDVMEATPQHTYQILTKRPARMRDFVSRGGPPLPNVWLGVSVENQEAADERIPLLTQTPARVRFLSCEPLLGPITFRPRADTLEEKLMVIERGDATRPAMLDGIHWVIAGGESGPYARPMHSDWPRMIRDQCAAADVAFFFKQWGDNVAWNDAIARGLKTSPHSGYWAIRRDARDEVSRADPLVDQGEAEIYARVGKKHAGRILDGRTHDAYPRCA